MSKVLTRLENVLSTMNRQEQEKVVLELALQYFSEEDDGQGQIVLYTDHMRDEKGDVVPFQMAEDADG